MQAAPLTTPADDEDSRLMARVAAGDAQAFTALVLRLHGPALGLATRVVGDRAEAEDIVQVALARLWTLAGRYDAARGSAGA